MKCPYCSSENTKVIDKRISEKNENRRRRECSDCSKRFTTYEKIEDIKRDDIQHIKKRDGTVVLFNRKKIMNAIFKAATSVGGKDRKLTEDLTNKTVEILKSKYDNENMPSVEDIQDTVEKVLIEHGHTKTAKAYILYRDQRKKIRNMKSFFLDIDSTISEYLNQDHWNVKENSNEAFSFSGLLLHVAGKVIGNYALNGIYTPQISKAHSLGYIHIHDLPNAIIAYCCGHSLKNLLLWGFGGVPNKVDAKPAKHIDVVVHQMINYIGCLQMEFAGAQAFSSVDTLLAPFVKKDGLNYKQVKQAMQKLVYSLNIPSRWGCFSDDTEILTKEGWKLGKKLDKGEIIATFNIQKEEIEYLPVLKMTKDDYKGKLYHLKNRISDQLITPNHKVLRKIHNFKDGLD